MLHLLLRASEARLREASHCPDGRLGAVRFVHRCGAALNAHVHCHCGIIDGVLAAAEDGPIRFADVAALSVDDVAAVQQPLRSRVLRWFVRAGDLDASAALDRAGREHGGGFSLDASVRIEAPDRAGLERLLRYCARPPFARDRLRQLHADQLVYPLSQPRLDGCTALRPTPLELIDRLAALIPPPRRHRHREATAPAAPPPNLSEPAAEPAHRRAARYAWALLLARIYVVFPLRCPLCGADMRLIAFITDAPTVRAILAQLGEPTAPPGSRPPAARRCGRRPVPSGSTRARHGTRRPSPNRPTHSINASPGSQAVERAVRARRGGCCANRRQPSPLPSPARRRTPERPIASTAAGRLPPEIGVSTRRPDAPDVFTRSPPRASRVPAAVSFPSASSGNRS